MLKEYINNQIAVLKDLCLWNYLSDEEKEELRQAPSIARANILMTTFRDKYYDIMIEDYERNPLDDYEDMLIEALDLKTKTKFSLLRSRITTVDEFMDFVQDYGWDKIQSFGVTAAKDIYSHIFDMSEDELNELVKTTKSVKNKGE